MGQREEGRGKAHRRDGPAPDRGLAVLHGDREGGRSVREGDTDAHGQATPTRPGTFGAYVVTDHVDAVYQRAKAAGAEIITEPYDTDYGSHDFAAADPEGNRWSFGTYRGEPRKNQ